MRQCRLPMLCLIAATCNGASACAATTPTVETQRQIFRDIYPAVELGDWAPAAENESSLGGYVLWPDLRAAYLRTRLKKRDDDAIRSFLAHYGTLKPARELRYRYALQLAADNEHAAFLALYEQFYQGLDSADLDCLALNARIASGQLHAVAKHATALWLIGKSQSDACNPVFDYLRNSGQLGVALYRQRFVLARDQRQFTLARYLARSIDVEHIAESNRWLAAQNSPEPFIRQSDPAITDPVYAMQLVYAMKNLALRNPQAARQHWLAIGRTFRFSQNQGNEVDRYIALWTARLNLPTANALLADLTEAAVNDEVLRWRIRTALRQKVWKDVVLHIASLGSDEKQREQWQYWLAIALQKTARDDESAGILATLANQRSYYGFLAADQLAQDYAFTQPVIDSDPVIIDRLATNPALVRARELFYVGLEGRGRSEWDAAVQGLDATDRRQAALLAHRWGWHSRAIATAAKSGDFGDLELRYPLPRRQSFVRFSADAHIRESWAYSIARSESLFMRDIRSSTGAIGIMQLLPETGRRTAREIGYPYQGRATLTDAAGNIRLGTFYLGKMYRRFHENRVLATAAYNAGPLRIDQWLPAKGTIDARIWIETIPFDETRKYVRRVLASDVIFHWRLTGEMRRLSSALVDIGGGETGQAAAQ